MRASAEGASAPASPLSPLFFFNDTATTEIYTLSLHDALPIYKGASNILGHHPPSCFGSQVRGQSERAGLRVFIAYYLCKHTASIFFVLRFSLDMLASKQYILRCEPPKSRQAIASRGRPSRGRFNQRNSPHDRSGEAYHPQLASRSRLRGC